MMHLKVNERENKKDSLATCYDIFILDVGCSLEIPHQTVKKKRAEQIVIRKDFGRIRTTVRITIHWKGDENE